MLMENIVFVDDEAHILEGFGRQFRKQFQVHTALGAEQALELIQSQGPFAVVMTDMRMPGIDGIELLRTIREIAPETVRIMLTGNADVETAMQAVNQGEIFRFLTKPCPPATIGSALESGIRQYQLIRSEKEVLEGTLRGSLRALSDVLAVVNPEAFGRAARLKEYVLDLSRQMDVSDTWQIECAALLSQIGCVILPDTILKKTNAGIPLTSQETQEYHQYPSTGADILRNIPRMEEVINSILYQHKHFDGSGIPHDALSREKIPLGARLLKVAMDYDALRLQSYPPKAACDALHARAGWYDPDVLEALKRALVPDQTSQLMSLSLSELQPHMIVAEEIYDKKNNLLVAKGLELSEWMVTRLKQMTGTQSVREPIHVLFKDSSGHKDTSLPCLHSVQ